jgi:hypothetical protein
MFFYMDESWQTNKYNVATIAAVSIPSNRVTQFENVVHAFKNKYLDQKSKALVELKGRKLVSKYWYNKEKLGEYCRNLNLTREILHYMRNEGCKVFASVCYDSTMMKLDCQDETRLDLPFKFLFERINAYMESEHPDKIATIIMDQRSSWKDNERIAATITRFFSRHATWKNNNRIHRSPYFSSSTTDLGTQLADIVCYCLTLHFSGERYADDLYRIVHEMEYHYSVGTKQVHSVRKIQSGVR